MTTPRNRTTACIGIMLVIIPIGLVVRYAPLHLPWFLWKYLGSTLWAVALYWLIAAFMPLLKPLPLAVIASVAATVVELSRLVPEQHIDAFRLTLAGRILLGRYFSPANIAAYLFAIAITAWVDARMHPGRN